MRTGVKGGQNDDTVAKKVNYPLRWRQWTVIRQRGIYINAESYFLLQGNLKSAPTPHQ